VLGQIPTIPAKARADVFAYLRNKPTSAAAEAIRNLRTSLLMSNVDAPPQVILSTSSLPGEGKTTQSLALAQNMAAMGQKVLLIEGDIRRRVFRDYFRIETQDGLLSVLGAGRPLTDVIWSDPTLGFDILMGEEGTLNAADLFSSRAFGEMLTQARELYDRILIDTPPVLAVPDARVIGQLADVVLYTVRWDHTHRDSVAEGLRLFETIHVPVAGLVLAQIDPKGVKRYGHAGAYGAYDSAYYHD
jgi:capsular exopolysaccharide synthesis family protein